MKTRPITKTRKRRAADEVVAPIAERAEAPAQSLETLRNPELGRAKRGRAALGLQRTVGNVRVGRELAQQVATRVHIQRRGKRWRPQPVRPDLIDNMLAPNSPLWRQLNPDSSAAVNCPATAAAVDEYLSTGQVNPAPAGDEFSEFRFATAPWSPFTTRFADIRSVVSTLNTFVVVEGRRSKAYLASHNITASHWFVVVNRNGVRGLDAYGEGQVIGDLDSFIHEQGFARFRYYRGAFRVVHISGDIPF